MKSTKIYLKLFYFLQNYQEIKLKYKLITIFIVLYLIGKDVYDSLNKEKSSNEIAYSSHFSGALAGKFIYDI